MKTTVLTIALALVATLASGQDKYFTRDGYIRFFSETAVENIEGINHKSTAVLDAGSGKVEFAVLMKGFEFEKALMEEHFNENYVESSTYPKAVFKGQILNFDPGAYGKETEVKVAGTLSLHGVDREITVPGTVQMKDGHYVLKSVFTVRPEDYDIEIPNAVRDNIAKAIEVTVNTELQPLKS